MRGDLVLLFLGGAPAALVVDSDERCGGRAGGPARAALLFSFLRGPFCFFPRQVSVGMVPECGCVLMLYFLCALIYFYFLKKKTSLLLSLSLFKKKSIHL